VSWGEEAREKNTRSAPSLPPSLRCGTGTPHAGGVATSAGHASLSWRTLLSTGTALASPPRSASLMTPSRAGLNFSSILRWWDTVSRPLTSRQWGEGPAGGPGGAVPLVHIIC